tara:strand:- start:180 stop:611 length:432 start_codon:yes stop_codon:yes gene_type:complete
MIKFSIKGVKEVAKQMERFGKEGKKEFSSITKLSAMDIEGGAKSLAPIDLGKLRQSISAIEIDALNWKVVVYSPYGPYVEFGTGKMVQVPQELADMAIQFKGKGIREVNLPARPYLYPSFVKGRGRYLKDLEKGLEYLTKKYS